MFKKYRKYLLIGGIVISFLAILVFDKFYFKILFFKPVKAANTISCMSSPYIIYPGDDITITAVVNFSASAVWAEIEDVDGDTVESNLALTSGDDVNYTKVYTTSSAAENRYDIGIYATVSGTGEKILCNPSNGSTWIEKSPNNIRWQGRQRLEVVSYNNKMWLIGGFTWDFMSDVWSSANGDNWQLVTQQAPWGERRTNSGTVVFNNKIYLFGGYKLNANWTALTFNNEVWYSTDGKNWTEATSDADWTDRSSFGYTVYNNKIWLTGGCDHADVDMACDSGKNDVWSTSNGVDWDKAVENASWSARANSKLLVHDDGSGEKLWLIGGIAYSDGAYKRDVYVSSDGATWTQKTAAANFEARYGFNAISYDFGTGRKLWVMAGAEADSGMTHHNDLWSSVDGITWTQAKDDVALPGIAVQPSKWTRWSPRRNAAAVLHDDGGGTKLWIMGGWDKVANENDVWYAIDPTSDDPETGWNLINTQYNAQYGNRYQPAMIAYNNKLWVLSGNVRARGLAHDVWSSTDGIDWICEYGDYTVGTEGIDCDHAAPTWVARWDHQLAIFDDGDSEKLFLIGGCSSILGGLNHCETAGELRDV
ncbi:MAG: hypothetical protein A2Y82_04475, partial [Candidatus Buchananbacteria bacterium RBG_13_36_9]